MVILNSIVSTINMALLALMFMFWREECTKAGKYGFVFLMLILTVNIVLIWM